MVKRKKDHLIVEIYNVKIVAARKHKANEVHECYAPYQVDRTKKSKR